MHDVNKFVISNEPEPHRIRTRQMLKSHPHIKKLIGKNPYSFFAVAFCVFAQIGIAYLLRDQPWWAAVLVAFCIGAFLSHNLFVFVHEATHNLIFDTKQANFLVAIFANTVQFVPSAISFIRYHIKHHAFQGVHELDADLPNIFEANLFKNRWWGKALWLFTFPIWQIARTFRTTEIKPFDGWMALNWVWVFGFDAALVYFTGSWIPLLYIAMSLFFSVGLHPLGARWIQEHYLKDGSDQETYSYYGILNKVQFNIGYHNEHHDFPSIPWNKLPELKATAPEYYDTLHSHKSWTALLFKFIFDPKMSMYSRVVRKERGKVKFEDQSTPDQDLIKAGDKQTIEA